MVFSKFITYVKTDLRDKAKSMYLEDKVLKDCLLFIDKYCIHLIKQENSIFDRMETDCKNNKNYGLIDGIFEACIVFNSNNMPVITLNVLITRNSCLPFDKLQKLKHVDIGYVYFIKCEFGYKIGMTKKLTDRLRTFGVKLPFDWSLFASIQHERFIEIERELHSKLSHKRINGEWFNITEIEWDIIREYCIKNELTLTFNK